MKQRLIRFLIRLLSKLEKKEVLLDKLVTHLYPGKRGVLMLATPEELEAMDKEFEEQYSDQELDFITDPKKEPAKGVIQ